MDKDGERQRRLSLIRRQRQPKSTLFPYTTLFRSHPNLGPDHPRRIGDPYRPGRWRRSEEHTSELQSHSELVCRLLLEKKKSKNVYSRVNRKATTQWRKKESANGVHLEGVASDNRS